jgi:hypothetical protein
MLGVNRAKSYLCVLGLALLSMCSPACHPRSPIPGSVATNYCEHLKAWHEASLFTFGKSPDEAVRELAPVVSGLQRDANAMDTVGAVGPANAVRDLAKAIDAYRTSLSSQSDSIAPLMTATLAAQRANKEVPVTCPIPT